MFEIIGSGGIGMLKATGRDTAIGESVRYVANMNLPIGQTFFVHECGNRDFAEIVVTGKDESVVKFI